MKHALALGLLAAAAAVPAHAGTLYVPYATDEAVGSARYRTEIVVTNPGDQPARVQMLFVAADGASHPATTRTVAAHGTEVVAGLAAAGRHGRVEVSGPDSLVVSARLLAYGEDGTLLSSAVEPIVSAQSLVPAGQTIHLQGLANTADAVTRWGVVTAGDRGTCSLAAYSADGAELGASSAALAGTLARTVPEPLQAFRSGSLAEARLEVTCDAPAFAYAAVLSTDGSRARFVTAGTSLAADLTAIVSGVRGAGPGGDGGTATPGKPSSPSTPPSTPSTPSTPAPADTPGQPLKTDNYGSFQIDGIFLDGQAGLGNAYTAYNVDLVLGHKYRKLTLDYDLYVGRYQTPIFHSIAGIRRSGKTLYMGFLMRADKSKTLVDLGHDKLLKDIGPWHQNTQYHVTMVVDAAAKKGTLLLLQDGKVVEQLSGKLTNTDLRTIAANKPVRIDFGIPRIADGAYFPPVTWKFSNLQLVMTP